MKRFRSRAGHFHLLPNSAQSDTGGLLKTGVLSLLFHIALIILLILNLKSAIPESRSNVYWVTIRPGSSVPLPLPEENQVQKEKNESAPEAREAKPIVEEKNQDLAVPLPAQPVIIRVPLDDQKQLPRHEKEEEKVAEPIPLPMTDVSLLSADLNKKKADDVPISLGPSTPGEQHRNTLSDAGVGEGPGIGPGGSGEGTGLGQGGSGLRVGYGVGYGPGPGGVSNGGGSRDGAGIRQGGSGWWGGDESGPGQGGSGKGISGKGGEGGPFPRYAKNPKPIYPQVAREKRYEGEVLLRVEVLSNGRVGQIEIKKSSGYDVLDQSALTTVKEWKFIPARRGDVPIPFWINIPIKFQLL
ncbi:MAG: energy transducer TonB [Thermodesulfobacteriota bacterium]